MVARTPLTMVNGSPQLLQAGDAIPIAAGGTGATDAASALAALGGSSGINPVFSGLTGISLPKGATADRPASPSNGILRYNTTLGCSEVFGPNGWIRVENTVLDVYTMNVAATSGSNNIVPYDNTPPLVTEGVQLWTATITPATAISTFIIEFSGMIDISSTDATATISIFKGSTLLGFITTSASGNSGNRPINVSVRALDTVSVATPVTYTCRIGTSANATWYIGRGNAFSQGGVNNSVLTITEVV